MLMTTFDVIHIIPFLHFGAGRAVCNLITGLHELGVRQSLVTAGDVDDLADDSAMIEETAPCLEKRITAGVFKRDPTTLDAAACALADLAGSRPVVFHANTGMSAFCALSARELLQGDTPRRVVATLMGGSPTKSREHKDQDATAANRCDLLLPISNAARDLMVSEGVREELQQVLYCGVYLDRIAKRRIPRGEARAALGLPPNAAVVGCVSQISPRKGLDTLLGAFHCAFADRDNVHLLLAGKGPERDSLMKRATALGLADRVHCPGFVPDAYAAMCAMDVVALASVYEGLGLALVEAQALGRPVVGTDCGGVAETFDHDRSGFLVPVGDEEALAEKLVSLISNPERARAMGEAGAEFVSKRFDIRAIVRELKEIYQKLLAKPKLDGG